jgi:hypothetical protein
MDADRELAAEDLDKMALSTNPQDRDLHRVDCREECRRDTAAGGDCGGTVDQDQKVVEAAVTGIRG